MSQMGQYLTQGCYILPLPQALLVGFWGVFDILILVSSLLISNYIAQSQIVGNREDLNYNVTPYTNASFKE